MLECRECEAKLDYDDAQWLGNIVEWVCQCGACNYLEYVEDTYDV